MLWEAGDPSGKWINKDDPLFSDTIMFYQDRWTKGLESGSHNEEELLTGSTVLYTYVLNKSDSTLVITDEINAGAPVTYVPSKGQVPVTMNIDSILGSVGKWETFTGSKVIEFDTTTSTWTEGTVTGNFGAGQILDAGSQLIAIYTFLEEDYTLLYYITTADDTLKMVPWVADDPNAGQEVAVTVGTVKLRGVVDVVLTQDIYVDVTEVTTGMYRKYDSLHMNSHWSVDTALKETTWVARPEGKNYPVTNVSWIDAVKYCNWRSTQKGLTPCYTLQGDFYPDKWDPSYVAEEYVCDVTKNGYRLPIEAEWEYAAKGGNPSCGWSTDNCSVGLPANQKVNMSGVKAPDMFEGIAPVAQIEGAKNAYGIYDMSGNVFEWVNDWYTDNTDNLDTTITGKTTRDSLAGSADGRYEYGIPLKGGSYSSGVQQVAIKAIKGYWVYNTGDDKGFRCIRNQ
jgi:formylglycine-generating enzyme required for sulfatase activity